MPSGQCTSRLPGAIGADLSVPSNDPEPDVSRTAAPSSRCRRARSSALISTSRRRAPVSGSTSRCTIELNCLPRRVETRNV